MEIIKMKYVSRCEMGVCQNKANYAIQMKRLGIRNEIHICKECLSELYAKAKKILPSSYIPLPLKPPAKGGANFSKC